MNGTFVVERTDRAFVRVFGREPVRMVQGLITNDLERASETRAVYAAMLTVKGKLLADVRAFRRADDVLLECHADALDNVTANLKKFVPPLFARFEVVDRLQMSSVHGPAATDVLQRALSREPPTEEDEIARYDTLLCVGSRYTGELGYDLIGELPERSSVVQQIVAAGAIFGQLDELEVRRVEAGTPRWGAELDESVIPLEAGLADRMISQSKGCYTGQEVVIRILHRGHVNRHLRRLLFVGSAPPAKGTVLLDRGSGRAVGTVTSAVESRRFGQTIGLGYVRRELLLPVRLALGTLDGPEVEAVELAPVPVSWE